MQVTSVLHRANVALHALKTNTAPWWLVPALDAITDVSTVRPTSQQICLVYAALTSVKPGKLGKLSDGHNVVCS
jgi:hypothetical protein